MRIDIFTPCDFAQAYGDKLVLSGTFNTIHCNAVPCPFSFSIVGTVSFTNDEAQRNHTLAIRLLDPDGSSMFNEISAPVQVGELRKNIVINVANIQISKIGNYSIQLCLDGTVIQQFELFIRLLGHENRR